MNPSPELQKAIDIVEQTNKKLMGHFRRDGTPAHSYKDGHSILTEVDLEINDFIVNELKGAFPGHKIVSEEADDVGSGEEHVWYVDPLDGTQNFADGLTLFGTSIGMAKSNTMHIGVIGLPHVDEVYSAEAGYGAYRNNTQITVNTGRPNKPSIIIGSAQKRREELAQFLHHVYVERGYNVRMFGCAVVNLLSVAAGHADACVLAGLSSWDYAAGAAIIREAGGKVTNFRGDEWVPTDNTLLASNGVIHDELVSLTNTLT